MSLTNEHGIGREEGLANDLPRMSANQAVTLPGCDFWKGVNWGKSWLFLWSRPNRFWL